MKTYVFFRGPTLIGIITCPTGMALTAEHSAKIDAAGISIFLKESQVPLHDGDMNRLVDILIERDWL